MGSGNAVIRFVCLSFAVPASFGLLFISRPQAGNNISSVVLK